MRKLTQKLKDASIGAFIPGSLAHQTAKAMIDMNVAEDVKNNNRTNINYTLGEKLYYGFLFSFIGLYELAAHTAVIDTIIEKYCDGTLNSEAAIISGGFGAVSRAALYLIYKAAAKESEQSVQEALNERAKSTTA